MGALPGSASPRTDGLQLFDRHHWPVTLRRGPVVLSPIRRRDRAAWERTRQANLAWLRPWEATLPPGAPTGPATYAGLLRSLTRQAREGRMLPWLIFWDPDPGRTPSRLVGQLTVSGIVDGSASWGQVGYWVDERYAGRGIIPTAVCLAVDYCFEVMRLHRLEVAIRPENVKSLRVVEKLGFRPEGIRPRYLHIDGDWRDHLVFALNAEEVPGGLLRRWEARPTT
ncbi:MAG: putative acetyltransferase [Friedmanniella sp.]|nr:putative acetyltransferase [Friedmanniella sp.]